MYLYLGLENRVTNFTFTNKVVKHVLNWRGIPENSQNDHKIDVKTSKDNVSVSTANLDSNENVLKILYPKDIEKILDLKDLKKKKKIRKIKKKFTSLKPMAEHTKVEPKEEFKNETTFDLESDLDIDFESYKNPIVLNENANVLKIKYVSDVDEIVDILEAIYACEICHQRFANVQNLVLHKNSHTKASGSKSDVHQFKFQTYECSKCPMKFWTRHKLNAHFST